MQDGLLNKQVVSGPDMLACSDPFEGALSKAAGKGIFTSTNNVDVCDRIDDVIILAVKPNCIVSACSDIMSSTKNNDALVISVAAGITLQTLENALPGRRVVRIMPNTPCLVSQAASGFCMGKLATSEFDKNLVKAIFGSVGIALEIKEDLLNAVTGLSGSGPAYVFEFIEALADGGVRVGLSRQDAMLLAAQTVKGAAEMILQTGQHPAVLKDQGTYFFIIVIMKLSM
jgi:pyrroline-5-carboxylate reductase